MNYLPLFIFFSFCGAISVIIYLLYLVHKMENEVQLRVKNGIVSATSNARMIVLNFEYDIQYYTYKLKGYKPVNKDEQGNVTWIEAEIYVTKQLEKEIGDLLKQTALYVYPTNEFMQEGIS